MFHWQLGWTIQKNNQRTKIKNHRIRRKSNKTQKIFRFLEITRRGFLQRSLRIESILKKKGLQEKKYLNAFQYMDDIFNSQYLMCNNIEGQLKNQASHKFEQIDYNQN
ncbi:unnamed protein product [Paramecium pentaurelia]|uniref:Uncharacterized protein n=1 Tax=Paramecium pentaurelia TaxID=43138 RepID=A0A8S1VHZ8_9CILI|nr:unnamed protein product [Paramecium pentaurelia]